MKNYVSTYLLLVPLCLQLFLSFRAFCCNSYSFLCRGEFFKKFKNEFFSDNEFFFRSFCASRVRGESFCKGLVELIGLFVVGGVEKDCDGN